ncbi:hypothetical protein Hanom_Chr00s121333g01811781 [Helianthus anomalus]
MDSVVQSAIPSKPIQSNVPSGTVPFLTKPNPKNYSLYEMSLPKSYQGEFI